MDAAPCSSFRRCRSRKQTRSPDPNRAWSALPWRLTDSTDAPSGVFFTDLWDDAGATVVERMAEPATAEWNALEEHTVADAMSYAPVHALTPETSVTHAAEYMGRAKIHRVLVMNGRALVGVATTSDITRAVAEGKLTARS